MRSHSAAGLAVKIGYKKIYRFPQGLPTLKELGLPVEEEQITSIAHKQHSQAATSVFGSGLLITLIGVFFGGMALNLTPCVYPLIPITASYFGGRMDESGKQEGHLIVHGLLYILGLSLMNSTLGVTAAFTGKLMGSLLQHSLVLIFVSSVLLAMAFNFFGFWELRMPTSFSRIVSKSHTGYFGTLFMGLTLGIVAAPCIGPFIIGLLTLVAERGSPIFGFLVFFTLSIGLGLPLFILSMFSGKLNKLPRSGEWMLWVRTFFGWIMVIMAVYFIKPVLQWNSIGTFAIYIAVLSAGIHLGFINKSGENLKRFIYFKRVVGLATVTISLLLALSTLMRGSGVAWQPHSTEILQESKSQGKPIIVDFYANWCTPCRKLEEQTFHDREVVEQSAGFTMVKVDLTKKGDRNNLNLLKQYKVKGVPTVIFLDVDGREIAELRLMDFETPKEFLLRMEKAR